jgi:hypothetical protein
MFIRRKTLDIDRQAWYHTGMCATCNNEETPRPAVEVRLAQRPKNLGPDAAWITEEGVEYAESPDEDTYWDWYWGQ